jgi:hypothetical protein
MTPKDKADKLFDTFWFVNTSDGLGIIDDELTLEDRKQCALIVVDEIEKALTDYGRGDSFQLQNMDSEFRFWEQVKQEIQNG